MGTWTTGFAEFHEELDLMGLPWEPYAPRFICPQCEASFDSQSALAEHRFELHKLQRPVLRIAGIEAQAEALVVVRSLGRQEIEFGFCDKIELNGRAVRESGFVDELVEMRTGKAEISLHRGGEAFKYKVEFRIADRKSLDEIDEAVAKLIREKRLDDDALNKCFLPLNEAITDGDYQTKHVDDYVQGLYRYFQGVMLREGRADGSGQRLEELWGYAATALGRFETKLARLVCGLMAFANNHFSEAAAFGSTTRVGAAGRFFMSRLAEPEGAWAPALKVLQGGYLHWAVDRLLSDQGTEELLSFLVDPDWASPQRLLKSFHTACEKADKVTNQQDRIKWQTIAVELAVCAKIAAQDWPRLQGLRTIPDWERWAEARKGDQDALTTASPTARRQ